MKTLRVQLLLAACIIAPYSASAQVLPAAAGPVVYGHHHLNVTNLEEQRKFWIDALGGIPSNLQGFPGDVVMFPNVLVMLREQKPSAGTKGTVLDHVAFQVPGLRATIDKLKGLGYVVATASETPKQYKVDGDIAFLQDQNIRSAFVMAPDDLKVEIVEAMALTQPIALHHLHFSVPDVDAATGWYSKVFGAKQSRLGEIGVATLPGVTLMFSKADKAVQPTAGTVLDHIGFEIENLQEFMSGLPALGVTTNRPFAEFGAFKLRFGFVTDPWGTFMELNEGLDRIFPKR